MGRQIITLTSDWGTQGFFAGMVKGALYSLVEGAEVVDIAHDIDAFNVMSATFVVKHACKGFPPGTIHLIDVGSCQPFLVVKCWQQLFICSDNGLPSMVFGDAVEDTALIPVQENGVYNFAAYNLFPRIAAKLSAGASLRDIGPQCALRPALALPAYTRNGDQYRIYVHHIDRYGNAYLGMTYDEFRELRQGRSFVMSIREQEVTELLSSYQQSHSQTDPRHKLRLTVSATGLLELAVKDSSLSQLLGLHVADSVLLRFK